ncbi:MAG TPA: NmrA family transcriptional regulator, partial [Candidatus Limnocylindria bacterium]|nr:NmrA family transcriptional regulator [Candidatus Limnocylindria bacterium]
VPISTEEYAMAMLAVGVPAEFANPLTELIATVLDGRNEHLSDGVKRALGREPRDFADFARDAAASAVWG